MLFARKKGIAFASAIMMILAAVAVIVLLVYGAKIVSFLNGTTPTSFCGISTAVNSANPVKDKGIYTTYEIKCTALRTVFTKFMLDKKKLSATELEYAGYTSEPKGDELYNLKLQRELANQLVSCWKSGGNRELFPLERTPIADLKPETIAAPVDRAQAKLAILKSRLGYDTSTVKCVDETKCALGGSASVTYTELQGMPGIVCMLCSVNHMGFDIRTQTQAASVTAPTAIAPSVSVSYTPFSVSGVKQIVVKDETGQVVSRALRRASDQSWYDLNGNLILFGSQGKILGDFFASLPALGSIAFYAYDTQVVDISSALGNYNLDLFSIESVLVEAQNSVVVSGKYATKTVIPGYDPNVITIDPVVRIVAKKTIGQSSEKRFFDNGNGEWFDGSSAQSLPLRQVLNYAGTSPAPDVYEFYGSDSAAGPLVVKTTDIKSIQIISHEANRVVVGTKKYSMGLTITLTDQAVKKSVSSVPMLDSSIIDMTTYLNAAPYGDNPKVSINKVLTDKKNGFPLQQFSRSSDQTVVYYQLFTKEHRTQDASRTGVVILPSSDVATLCDVIANRG